MFVSFRKCSRPQKPDLISDRNCQNLYPFSDQNGSKTIPFGAAHTYIPYIGEYPPPPSGNLLGTDTVYWSTTLSFGQVKDGASYYYRSIFAWFMNVRKKQI